MPRPADGWFRVVTVMPVERVRQASRSQPPCSLPFLASRSRYLTSSSWQHRSQTLRGEARLFFYRGAFAGGLAQELHKSCFPGPTFCFRIAFPGRCTTAALGGLGCRAQCACNCGALLRSGGADQRAAVVLRVRAKRKARHCNGDPGRVRRTRGRATCPPSLSSRQAGPGFSIHVECLLSLCGPEREGLFALIAP